MESDLVSRRQFLLDSSTAALAPLLVGASSRALFALHRQAASVTPPPGVLTPAQLAVIEAVTNRIFPAVDGQPNASAMHAPQFIDIGLRDLFPELQIGRASCRERGE